MYFCIICSNLTFGTHTIKHLWAHGLVGFANGAGAGKATLENGSFDACEAKIQFETQVNFGIQ